MKLGGQHIVLPERTPIANLHLTLLQKVGSSATSSATARTCRSDVLVGDTHRPQGAVGRECRDEPPGSKTTLKRRGGQRAQLWAVAPGCSAQQPRADAQRTNSQ